MKQDQEDMISDDEEEDSINKRKSKHQKKKQESRDVRARDDGSTKLYKSRIK